MCGWLVHSTIHIGQEYREKWFPVHTSSIQDGALTGCCFTLALNLDSEIVILSISTSAQYVTLDNKIKCLSLAVFFCNPTNETV